VTTDDSGRRRERGMAGPRPHISTRTLPSAASDRQTSWTVLSYLRNDAPFFLSLTLSNLTTWHRFIKAPASSSQYVPPPRFQCRPCTAGDQLSDPCFGGKWSLFRDKVSLIRA